MCLKLLRLAITKAVNMEKFQLLMRMTLTLEEEFTKFYVKGNQAAGTRIRKAMQEIKQMAQEIREEVQKMKNE